MGLAASQVRLLTLQNRKSTVGLRLGMLSQREIALANKMDDIAKEYTDALDNKTLQWTVSTGKYVDITYDRIMTPMKHVNQCNPHIITDRNGKVVLDSRYNQIVSKSNYNYIFRPSDPTKPPASVRPAVIDYITSNDLGIMETTNNAFVGNDVRETVYRDAKIAEVFDYLAGQIDSIDDSEIKSQIQLIVKNYRNNMTGYAQQTYDYHMPKINYYTEDSNDEDFYPKIIEFLEGDDGIGALRSLADVEGFEQYADIIDDSIDNAINYFSEKSHVTASSMAQASPEELAKDVEGYMGTKISSYSLMPIVHDNCGSEEHTYENPEDAPEVYRYHINHAAFSYRMFYDYVLADLSGYSNAFTADGNTDTNLKIINDTPATVTIPSLEDMAMNIVNVCKTYLRNSYPNYTNDQINEIVSFSNALDWLENGFYYTNSQKTANLNYCMEQYLFGTEDSNVNATVSSLYSAIFDSGNFNDNYISSLSIYSDKTFERNTNGVIEEYWKGISQDEVDFYTVIFESIRDKGYVYSANGTEKEYLNLMLKNNMYLIDDLYVKSCPKVASVCVNQKQQEEALSKYEAQMALINEKEEDIQLEIESLNTEYTMIKSEISSLKNIIKDNIQTTFKMNA